MRQTILIYGCGIVIWGLGNPQFCFSSIITYSVDRGITVDGATLSSTNPGAFTTSLSNTTQFGTASAYISSHFDEGIIKLSGWAEIRSASNEEFSPEGRAILFLDASFSIDRHFEYDLKGLLIGMSDSEHWRASLSLTGPATNFAHSAWDRHLQLDQTGTLPPGDYVFSVRAEPLVLGGLDGGSATAYIAGSFDTPDLEFILTPLGDSTNGVPELGALAMGLCLGLVGLAHRPPALGR